jgi:DNA repair exonuclease SbcCD ATPase subunit
VRIIESLKVINCGVLGTRSLKFTEGFNVVRGANEAGKSTVLEAIGIAFFGNSAMRGTWEDLVTDGEKVGSLLIELHFDQYTIKRSQSSASVVSDDGQVKIAGHNDVTAFFLRLFGLEKGTESYIMIAKQGAIQGILESGATDATKFIENLAGFEQIDNLVARMKKKYPVVDKQALEQQLLSLEVKLDNKLAEELPDVATDKADLQGKQDKQRIAQGRVDLAVSDINKLSSQLETLKEQQQIFRETTATTRSQQVFVDDLKTTQTGFAAEIDSLKVSVNDSKEKLAAAQAFLDQVVRNQADFASYEKVRDFKYCEETWDEDFDSLTAALSVEKSSLIALEAQVKANDKKITQLETATPVSDQLTALTVKRDDLVQQQAVLKAMTEDSEEVKRIKEALIENEQVTAVAKSKWIEEKVCPTCGTDLEEKAAAVNEAVGMELAVLGEDKHVLKGCLESAYKIQKENRSQQEKDLNNEYTKTIRKLETVIAALKVANDNEIKKIEALTSELQLQIADSKTTIQSMEGIIDCQSRVEELLESVADKVTVDKTLYPWILSWAGVAPQQPDQDQVTQANNDVVFCQDMASQLKSKNEQYQKCCNDIKIAEEKLVVLQEALSELVDHTDSIDDAVAKIAAAKLELSDLQVVLQGCIEEVSAAATKLALDEQAVRTHAEAVLEIKGDIKVVQGSILASAENNGLHRAVADARGVVVEGVWNKLFAVTNECFSQIRGTVSDITRDGKLFRVNNMKTVRLSGSTLDSLGLAMRAAIRDIFAPATDFVLLDEIAAGADPTRTAAMMAQVACLNVGQKILVTHEEISDSLANNIVEV